VPRAGQLKGYDAIYFYLGQAESMDAQRLSVTITDQLGHRVVVNSQRADLKANRINFMPPVSSEPRYGPNIEDVDPVWRTTIVAPKQTIKEHGLWVVSLPDLEVAGIDINRITSVVAQGLPDSVSISGLGVLGDGTTASNIDQKKKTTAEENAGRVSIT